MEIKTSEILTVSVVDGENSDGLIITVMGTDDVMLFEFGYDGVGSVSEAVSDILRGYLEALSSMGEEIV